MAGFKRLLGADCSGKPTVSWGVGKRIEPALSMRKEEEEQKSRRGGMLEYLLLDGVLACVTVRTTADMIDVRAAKKNMASRQMGVLLQSLCRQASKVNW